MRKPLAGKRAFYAMGQSAAARGEPWSLGHRARIMHYPEWAWHAFYRGYYGLPVLS